MKLGVFGGSFDPPHLGHVAPVRAARRRLGLDRVLYVPTANPPHKADPESAPEAPAPCRYAMVEMALLAEEDFYASAIELRTDRTSYTVETLEHFRAEQPDAELHLIIGSDSLAGLDSWKRWHELPKLARLAVLARPGAEPERIRGALPEALRELFDRGGIDLLDHVTIDVSSTEIRNRLARGEPLGQEWMNPLVLDYVRKYRFYR